MSRALRELGLGPDADERAVKRAYAARLKVTRPDSDPDGFQALNAAYQTALQQLSSGGASRAAVDVPQVGNFASEDAQRHTPATAAAPDERERTMHIDALPDRPAHEVIHESTAADRPFEFGFFYAEMREHASIDNTAGFKQWLQSQQALYDISLKDRVAEQLVFQLRGDPPLPRNYLQALLHFFSLDTINALSWRLQDELNRLIESASPSTGHGPDWSQLKLDPALKPKPFQESPWGLRILGLFLFTLLGLSVATWVTDFIRETLAGYSHTRKTP